MSFELFTESAAAIRQRDKIMANREKVEELTQEMFSLQIGDENYTGVHIAQSIFEELDAQDWIVVRSFARAFFEWLEDHGYDHLIPHKYTSAYLAILQLKYVINEDFAGMS